MSQITRRQVLNSSLRYASTFAIAAACPSSALRHKKKTMHIVAYSPAHSSLWWSAVSDFIHLVHESNPQVQWILHDESKLPRADRARLFRMVQAGKVDAIHSVSSIDHHFPQHMHFFSRLPFGMDTERLLSWHDRGDGARLWENAMRAFELHVVPFGVVPNLGGTWARQPVAVNQESLSSAVMRTSPEGQKIWQKLGVKASWMRSGKIREGIQLGHLDFVERLGVYHDSVAAIPTAMPYCYKGPWYRASLATGLFFNRRTWESLPGHAQEAIHLAAEATMHIHQPRWVAAEKEAALQLERSGRVRFLELPHPIAESLRTEADRIRTQMGCESLMAEEIFASYTDWQRSTEPIAIGSGYMPPVPSS